VFHIEFPFDKFVVCAVSEEVLQMQSDEIEADVSIGTEIPDQEQIDDVHYVEEVSPSYSCMQEDPSTSDADYHAYEDHGKLTSLYYHFRT
jgi:hypothetical protein